MSVLLEFKDKFQRSQTQWTKSQWKQIATELASRLDADTKPEVKRGRPKSAMNLNSMNANLQALAWQIYELRQEDPAMKITDAMDTVINEARRDVDGKYRISGLRKTAYRPVQKILKKWAKNKSGNLSQAN